MMPEITLFRKGSKNDRVFHLELLSITWEAWTFTLFYIWKETGHTECMLMHLDYED